MGPDRRPNRKRGPEDPATVHRGGPQDRQSQYPIGSVAMANSNSPATTDPSTNGSQFFIVTGPEGEDLSPDYTLFGKVTSG